MKLWLLTRWLLVLLQLPVCAGAFQLVSTVDPSIAIPVGGAGDSGAPIISPDGRYVLFASTAKDLVLTTNGAVIPSSFPAQFDVYLHDRDEATTALVSVSTNGISGGNGDSIPTGLSNDGRYALFESSASNLVANVFNNPRTVTNGVPDVYVRDMVNGTTTLVSIGRIDDFSNWIANGASRGSAITPDGRYAAFVSAASNLVAGDTNGIPDVFVRDLQSGTTILASPGARAVNVSSASESPEISADGRYVAFYSTATNLVSGVGTAGEIYMRDLVDGVTILASAGARAALFSVTGSTSAVSYNHAISDDAQFIAYAVSHTANPFSGIILRYSTVTGLTDLVHTNALMFTGPREDARTLDMTPDGRFIAFLANTDAPGTVRSVLVWDAETGSTTLASANLTNGPAVGHHEWPSIDSTGRFVCFTSTATDLTTNSAIAGHHVHVRDLQSEQTILVDVDADGVGFGVASFAIPHLSADGRLVAFQSYDAPGGTGNLSRNSQVFARDLLAGTTELVSARHPEVESLSPNGTSVLSSRSVSRSGRYVAFASLASNLVANDTNENRDVFVRDLLDETTVLASVGMDGFSAAGMSFEPAISDDGQFIAFTSMATNLVPLDSNPKRDVYVRDLQTDTTILGSIAMNGTAPGNNSSFSPFLSEAGRYLFFRSKASNLAAGSFASGSENLFWRDLQTAGTVALTTSGVVGAAMTPDGRYAAYHAITPASLFIWDSLAAARIYTNASFFGGLVVAIRPDGGQVAYISSGQLRVLDRVANTNWAIGALATNFVARAGVKFSGDGFYLTYASPTAQALTDTNETFDVYLYHLPSGAKTLVSRVHNLSEAANAASNSPDISFDGRFVAYRSAASNIVPHDANGWPDVFVYDRSSGNNRLLSRNHLNSSGGNNRSLPPVFSGDGRTLVFPSWASDLTVNDFNQSGDLFGFTFLYATITREPGQPPVISWPAVPGQNYIVQFKNDLNDPDWQEVSGTVVIADNQASIQDLAPDAAHRIYRVAGF